MADAPRQTLPLPDYDELPLGTLEHRIRALDTDALEQLMTYERAHAHRTAVIQLLDNRIQQVAAGSALSGGDPAAGPERAHARAGSKVSPATSPEPRSAPPHGNPDQPGRPKGNR
ncbi:hypothetical protein [Streptomyces indicus]|uniref:DUF8129 domain-containing protein n=1 Tax=Streptomyces indicus TaxID=417292 RepID=A0A1G8TPJ0_9ACTN|nr:hypothetical protein [Streptomyces indicus]SDJ43324.1 hypothetical protein SAMN05421806_101378 [Streptomyces indicus]